MKAKVNAISPDAIGSQNQVEEEYRIQNSESISGRFRGCLKSISLELCSIKARFITDIEQVKNQK
ncbi:MAG: hypothetical protein RM021_018605 [Nostoc sp. EkiNYC01]|nr:hypothetical protein [Nostoc sp. EkiNYC01]